MRESVGGGREGTYVHLLLIHVNVCRNQTNIAKQSSINQLKINKYNLLEKQIGLKSPSPKSSPQWIFETHPASYNSNLMTDHFHNFYL